MSETDLTAVRNEFFKPEYSPVNFDATGGKKHFLEKRHRDYDKYFPRWQETDDFYSGEALEKTKLTTYLKRRPGIESKARYDERCELAVLYPHTAVVIDTFSGLLELVADDATNTFDEPGVTPLGTPEDPTTPLGQLYRNTDGNGQDWSPFWLKATSKVSEFRWMWFIAEGITKDEDGLTTKEPHFRSIDPRSVTNWRHVNGKLVEAVVQHTGDMRTSIADDFDSGVQMYTLYHLFGWILYKLVKKKGTTIVTVEDQGQYDFYETAQKLESQRILPIFRTLSPLDRDVAWLIARQDKALMNMDSEQRIALRRANISPMVLVGNKEQFEQHEKNLVAGYTTLQHYPDQSHPHYYLEGPVEAAKMTGEKIEKDTRKLYVTAFQQFNDAAKTSTATEMLINDRTGKQAYLVSLQKTMDEAKNQALFRLEQIYFPNDSSKWKLATTEGSTNFKPINMDELIEKLVDMAFAGRALPLTPKQKASITKKALEFYGETVEDEAEIEEEARRQEEVEVQEEDILAGLEG